MMEEVTSILKFFGSRCLASFEGFLIFVKKTAA